jgi:hypothetical protein
MLGPQPGCQPLRIGTLLRSGDGVHTGTALGADEWSTMADVTVGPGSPSAGGSVGWERARAVAGIGLSIAAVLGVVIFLINAVRVGSAVHVVPSDMVHRWRRDYAVRTGHRGPAPGGRTGAVASARP